MAADTRRAKLKILLRIKDQILIIIATILFILLLIPVGVLLILPCFIYRKIVIILAKCFKPKLGKLMCGRSALAAIDDIYNSPKCTLLGVAVVEGDADVKALQADIQKRVMEARNPKGELMYPELQQYFSEWCGFKFWKWSENFSIEDHVSVYPKSETCEMNELDLINLRVELISKPYKKGKSPWEWVVVRNYRPMYPLMIDIDNNCGLPETMNANSGEEMQEKSKKSVLIMRIHHGVTDGYSLLKLFLNTMQNEELKINDIPQPKYHRRSYLQTILYYGMAAISVPYYVTSQLMATYDDNFFHPKGVKLIRKCSAAGITLPISIVKDVREKHGATFSAVLMSAVAGGIRNYMIANQIPIPDKMHLTSPLPWPNHPSKLRNYWSFCILNLPLDVADPRERLRYINRKREAIVKSTVPFLNLMLVPLIGSLPIPFIEWATKRKATTIMMSNFPGPQEPSTMFGHQILDASFGGGFGSGNLAFGISAISYNGTMRMGLGVDQAIFPKQQQAQELLTFIKEEIFILGQDIIV